MFGLSDLMTASFFFLQPSKSKILEESHQEMESIKAQTLGV
jgi:hypothetical protein